MILGAHISAAGGHARAFDRARELGADCLQIFTRAPSAWKGKPIAPEDLVVVLVGDMKAIGPGLEQQGYKLETAAEALTD